MAQSKITYKIDLKDFVDKPDKELANEVGEFLLDKILEYASKAKSPVSGEDWKSSLSPKYKTIKSNYSIS